ncbi:hypothetical protein J7E96_24515 [Streptomyces sp. ISL-96]|uniref:hypothetical protein n=1 Tax=Streptomyces sp. ISL-96 TaxID=2819191 RepID=UPI001BEC1D32|nr:hypothetical protein [Streptomyces sp. ISL-96]MBT2491632.1 hypothetical protein [Streptomyces sp. ISL-96]
MSEDPGVHELRLGIYATQQQADEIKERITRLLCPDPDHAPPCPVPWSMSMVHMSDPDARERHPGLVEQAEAEKHLRP